MVRTVSLILPMMVKIESNEAVVSISINPVNDAPALTEVDGQSVDEGTAFTYNLSAIDVDGDDLTFSAVSDSNVVISIYGSELSIFSADEKLQMARCWYL